jgi:membrane-bound lytic murein transglycosylase D
MKKLITACAIVFIALAALGAQDTEPDPFVTPKNLEANVAFWKKIYSEVGLTEGLLHDRDYPMVIYKKITVGKVSGRERRRIISKYTKTIRHMLDNINKKPPSRWSEEETELAGLFKKYGAEKDMKNASSRIRFQLGQKERFKEGLERSGAYLGYIRGVFKQYGIPQRIAYLPHVESSFNINAYSKVGAAGMWQFMRQTGRLFMTVDYRVDERRDPYISTIAAAKLLKRNYEELNSWPLAITAYNHGTVSIKRASKQLNTTDIGIIVENYKNRRFRFASKNFYSCFLAASEISESPGKYFPNFNYDLPEKYNEVVLESFIQPAVLAASLGVTQQELARLNPSLRSTVFQRKMSIPRGFRLRIPVSLSTEDAVSKIANIPVSKKASISPDHHYYTVRRGDTLYRIARNYGVSTEAIMASNDIMRENRIYVGQVLRIPGKNNPVETRTEKTTAPPTQSPSQNITPPPAQNLPAKTELPERDVPSASTLPGPPPVEMKTAETSIDPGTFDATLYNLDVSFYPEKGTTRIQVAVDETLGHYADWLGISVGRIRALNNMSRGSLKVNRWILLPMDEQSLERFNARRLEFHMALEEDFYNLYQVVEVKTRKVRNGETLWSICNRGNNGDGEIPLWLFKKYNREIDIEKIGRNTKIKLPVIKNKSQI